MKTKLLIGALLLLALPVAAQDTAPVVERKPPAGQWYVGLDLGKYLFPWGMGERVFVLEPVVKFVTPDKWVLSGNIGYSTVSRRTMRTNLYDYTSEGIFVKVGAEKWLELDETRDLIIGINAAWARFDERGDFILRGTYFGDAYVPLNLKNQRATGFESTLGFQTELGKNLFLAARGSLGMAFGQLERDLTQDAYDSWFTYYIPGMGHLTGGAFQGLTANASLQLLYRIR